MCRCWPVDAVEAEKECRDYDRHHPACLGTEQAARQPVGASPLRFKKFSDGKLAGITSRIEKDCAPVEGDVPADDERQRSSATHGEAPEKRQQARGEEVLPSFIWLAEVVDCSKSRRQQSSRRPETDAIGESPELVGAEGELLDHADGKRGGNPKHRKLRER